MPKKTKDSDRLKATLQTHNLLIANASRAWRMKNTTVIEDARHAFKILIESAELRETPKTRTTKTKAPQPS